jgi:hypothetical protein
MTEEELLELCTRTSKCFEEQPVMLELEAPVKVSASFIFF